MVGRRRPEGRRVVTRVGYAIGVVLLFLAAATLVAQLLAIIAHQGYATVALGSIWAAIDAGSLAGARGLIERGVSPAVWRPIAWVLGLPAWLVLGLLGGPLYL